MSEIERTRSRLRQHGLSYYLRQPKYIASYSGYLFRLLKERWSDRRVSMYIFEMPLETFRRSQLQSNQNVLKQCINSVEPMLEYARIRELEEPAWNGNYVLELERRFARGDFCFAMLMHGKVVSHIFVTQSYCDLGEVSYRLRLPQYSVGLYDVYTLFNYRGKGLYKTIFSYCVGECYNKGFQRALMWIVSDNIKSIMVHSILGMRRITLEVIMRQRWGLRWHQLRSLSIDSSELLKLSGDH